MNNSTSSPRQFGIEIHHKMINSQFAANRVAVALLLTIILSVEMVTSYRYYYRPHPPAISTIMKYQIGYRVHGIEHNFECHFSICDTHYFSFPSCRRCTNRKLRSNVPLAIPDRPRSADRSVSGWRRFRGNCDMRNRAERAGCERRQDVCGARRSRPAFHCGGCGGVRSVFGRAEGAVLRCALNSSSSAHSIQIETQL